MRLSTFELMQQAEQELDDGRKTAPKTLERLRRELLKQGEIPGLEQLLELARRVDDRGSLAYTIQQNIKHLHRMAELRVGAQSRPGMTLAKAGPPRFLFGDPRRPLSLAAGWIVWLVIYPFVVAGMVFMWALGDPTPAVQSDQQKQHGWRVIWVIGAVLLVSAIAVTTLAWVDARRSYPPEKRKALGSAEGISSGVVVLVLVVAAISVNIWAWKYQP